MKILTLRLDEALYAKIRSTSKQRKTTRSEVVREALNAYFEKSNNSSKESAFELANDLAGTVAGPTTLSFNKIHLKGFGR
ncbi:MAG: ribbon-helix-helix domain-containing protein [Nitrospira sp.]|nr:ribbon-helix-helix domain-containing protein [Nitrospira sp.]MDE0404014.1 ribbon-helix-helix domain-containing protein [Nitrospira sp.]